MSDDTLENTVILIVDDHPIYLDGISLVLQDLFKGSQVLQAGTAKEALKLLAERFDIDWIFLDFQLPDGHGLDLLKDINDLMITAPIIMMSGSDDTHLVANAIEGGASGFIHKAGGRTDFKECFNAIERDGIYLAPEMALKLDHFKKTTLQAKNEVLSQLSDRRRDVLVLVAEGYSNGEIASTLSISEATVKAHVSALMTIFDADNRSHCVAEARKLGIVS